MKRETAGGHARRIDLERGFIEMHRTTPTPKRAATPTVLSRHEGGYAAQGPGFYVWDRDPSEVIRLAEALQTGRRVGSATARFMVIGGVESLDS